MVYPVRSSCAEIDLAAFRWNFQQIENLVKPARIIAVVKADAYGHGVEEVAREAERLGAAYLCVAFVQEGFHLRESGITCPILVLIPPVQDEIACAIDNGLELVVHSYEQAREIDSAARKLKKKPDIQANIDTGMHRTGIHWEHAVKELIKINKLKNLSLNGLFTHFATSDWSDLNFAKEQLERFQSIVNALPFSVPFLHTANSGAIMQIPESYYSYVRPGISLYGYYPSLQCKRTLPLKPVLKLKSYVAHVKEYEANERFSYSLTYRTERRTGIATVPAGYADGVNRLLSNNGSVLIRDRKFPVVGIVTMDAILVDVGLESGVKDGDEVVLLGTQKYNEISMNEWCERLKTIPYEVTCNISKRIPRVVINKEQR
ncbi:alanine racemase [candidate division KSB1 bacterium]